MRNKVLVLAFGIVITLGACSTKPQIDHNTWTCDSLVQPIIDMSKSRDIKILEINNYKEEIPHDGVQIRCIGAAEWSSGSEGIHFGAELDNEGNIKLEYSKP